jgi:hypothetical protein
VGALCHGIIGTMDNPPLQHLVLLGFHQTVNFQKHHIFEILVTKTSVSIIHNHASAAEELFNSSIGSQRSV